MPIVAKDIDRELRQSHALVYPFKERKQDVFCGTGSTVSSIAFINTNNASDYLNKISKDDFDNTVSHLDEFSSNKKYIKFEQQFDEQFEKLKEYFEGITVLEAKNSFSKTLSSILELNPDAISTELTHEKSTFFTIKKGDYTMFMQQFFGDIEEGDDEAILTVFKAGKKLPSYAGALFEVLQEISNTLNPGTRIKIEYVHSYELSY